MSIRPPQVAESEVDAWCERWLGAAVTEVLFTGGHLSRVVGVRLTNRRAVVVKIRRGAPRLAASAQVQRALWQAGFPCPRPLAGPTPFGGYTATAEEFVPGGERLGLGGVAHYAALLALLVDLAPAADTVSSLHPNPAWVPWDHPHRGAWPRPDDRDDDLNTHPESAWLDEVAVRVSARLARLPDAPTVLGHGDWEARNLSWQGTRPYAVHDWDSVVRAPEPIVAGLAAAVWPCGVVARAATVDESAAFLDAYLAASGLQWTRDWCEAAWAAGLWVDAFNAKKASLDGEAWLDPADAEERLRRAGA